MNYKKAGVDIDLGNHLVDFISQQTPNSKIGGFASVLELSNSYKNPLLITSTDGVGSKLQLASSYNRLKGIGQDLVAMCVNDVICCGAKPLWFLDYLAFSKLSINQLKEIVGGILEACQKIDCLLVGGETAQIPKLYKPNQLDLAGFCLGLVEKEELITPELINPKDIIIGIHSSGIHSNGYSLILKLLKSKKIRPEEEYLTINNQKVLLLDLLLEPTLLYVNIILSILQEYPNQIHGIAHITGGGMIENIPRILPPYTEASINFFCLEISPLYQWIFEKSKISVKEMLRVFNCGIGMVLVVDPESCIDMVNFLNANKYPNTILGSIESSNQAKPRVKII